VVYRRWAPAEPWDSALASAWSRSWCSRAFNGEHIDAAVGRVLGSGVRGRHRNSFQDGERQRTDRSMSYGYAGHDAPDGGFELPLRQGRRGAADPLLRGWPAYRSLLRPALTQRRVKHPRHHYGIHGPEGYAVEAVCVR